MRILRLDLAAIGPFTDVRLDLSVGDYGLHLIYGSNEAGKSSALRALRQMLFGIDERTSDNFLHSNPNLRVGGEIAGNNGQPLAFVRRKGRKGTLRDPVTDKPLDDDAVQSLLGGVNADLFETMFGLDHVRLREGGQEIVEGGGELGRALFAAATGVAHLRAIQQDLDTESAKLFKPKAKNPTINQGLRTLAAKRKEIRDTQLSGRKWGQLDRTSRKTQQEIEQLDAQIQDLEGSRRRLARINEALPSVSRYRQCQSDLEALAGVSLLLDDFPQRHRQAQSELDRARTTREQSQARLERLEAQRELIPAAADVLAHADAVDQLHRRLGSHQKAAEDRSRLAAERNLLRTEAANRLKDLRPDLVPDDVEALRLPQPAQKAVRELAAEHAVLADREAQARQNRASIEKRIAAAQQRLEELPASRDPQPLEATIGRLRAEGRLQQQLDDAHRELNALEQRAGTAIGQLGLRRGSLEELVGLPVPSTAAVATCERNLDEIERVLNAVEKSLDDARSERQDTESKLRVLELTQEVPLEDDLTAARGKREHGWQLVLADWQGKPPPTGDVAGLQTGMAAAELAEAYKQSVADADEIADRLRRESDRVARRAQLTAEGERLQSRIAKLSEQFEASRKRRGELQAAWSAEWSAASIDPLSPREMQLWLLEREKLVELADEVQSQRSAVEELERRVASSRADLLVAMTDIGESVPAECSLAELLDRAERTVVRLAEQRQERDRIEREVHTMQDQLREATDETDEADARLARWRQDWLPQMQRLGLNDAAPPVEALELLDGLAGLFDRVDEEAKLDTRIADIDADAEQFRRDVRSLAKLAAADLGDAPAEQVVPQLHNRIHEARAAQERRDELTRQIEAERTTIKTAKETIAEQTGALDRLCKEAGCQSADDLPAAQEDSRRRRATEEQFKQTQQELSRYSGKGTIDDFLDEVAAEETDEIDSEIERIEAELDECRETRNERLKVNIESEQQLASFTGGANAAIVEQERQDVVAAVEDAVDRYCRLSLARALLAHGIQRFREKNQTPVLKRAAELFARLTLGSFADLRDDFNDKGESVLVGVRPEGGQTVGIEGMSDGTCDQLYLALRLAGLENYLKDNPPLPLILDDVLVNFDDDRSAAALEVLAELSSKTQVLFFTHHHRVVELAQNHIPAEALVVQSLA